MQMTINYIKDQLYFVQEVIHNMLYHTVDLTKGMETIKVRITWSTSYSDLIDYIIVFLYLWSFSDSINSTTHVFTIATHRSLHS